MTDMEKLGERAVKAESFLRTASGKAKNEALLKIAEAIIENKDKIIKANAEDLERGKAAGLTDALLDRLRLDDKRVEGMAQGVRDVAALADPVGRVLGGGNRPNGMTIVKVAAPLGVVAVIYEARPNVTADAASLCLKSGNAVILRGGKEAMNSNKAIAAVMREALKESGIPEDSIQLCENSSHEAARELMRMNKYIDVLIPRGSGRLIQTVVQNATVPVIETGVGNCHVYVDKSADVNMAAEIVFNAKTSRPSVCNACESLLVHKDIAEKFLPVLNEKLSGKVELRGDENVCSVLPNAKPATDDDWGTEYLDYILSVKTVESLEEGEEHINKYGTRHSECIVTNDHTAAEHFLNNIDAAAVYVNASTRFTDGAEFGFGEEIGISTQKLHARGPLGLDELTCVKYKIYGNGQIRV